MASVDSRTNMDPVSSGKAHPVTHTHTCTHTPTPLQLVTQHLKSVFPISPLILAEQAPKSSSPPADAKGIKTAAHVSLARLAPPNQTQGYRGSRVGGGRWEGPRRTHSCEILSEAAALSGRRSGRLLSREKSERRSCVTGRLLVSRVSAPRCKMSTGVKA